MFDLTHTPIHILNKLAPSEGIFDGGTSDKQLAHHDGALIKEPSMISLPFPVCANSEKRQLPTNLKLNLTTP